MKKILFLIPLWGICSSLLAQAPQVTNVQAQQIAGTKDVSISLQLTGKLDESGFDHPVYGEVWFKEIESMTTWTKVSSISGETAPGTIESLNLFEYNPDTGENVSYPTIVLGEIGDAPKTKTLTWKAGDDAPNINTSSAKIRIIAFYPKMNEDGVTEKPVADQVSGWNGEGEFGGSGGSPDGNGSTPTAQFELDSIDSYGAAGYSFFDASPGGADETSYGTAINKRDSILGNSGLTSVGSFNDGVQTYPVYDFQGKESARDQLVPGLTGRYYSINDTSLVAVQPAGTGAN